MSKIKCLSSHVADMIAAGEVVERPGSAVKELIENSIDAGASSLTVEIQHGGMSYIRVSDNGCGMSAEDAETAFLRHATSKLRDEFGLEAIGTLGFRGEALAAIAAVSVVELMTRETGAVEGTSIRLEAGVTQEVMPVGCPEGTTIIVRSLFYNTPARLKFMKKDSAEGANVTNVVIRCALSHPNVAVRYIKDGEEQFQTPGDGNLEGCIYSLLGRDFAKNILAVSGSGDGGSIKGFITPPANARGNRGAQFFFVNGRYVKSAQLQAALEQAYKNSLFTGRFPGCVLYLDIKLNEVDVNVHPAKTEVKFLNERKVFDLVYLAVKSALERESTPPEIKISDKSSENSPSASPAVLPTSPLLPAQGEVKKEPSGYIHFRQEGIRYNSPAQNRPFVTHRVPIAEPVAPPHETLAKSEKLKNEIFKALDKQAARSGRKTPGAEPGVPNQNIPAEPPKSADFPEPAGSGHDVLASPIGEPALPAPDYRIIGEAFTEYIVVESGGEIIFIDKHAAHERMLFDRLKSRRYETMSQILLVPAIAELDSEDKELLLENSALLDELGFEISDFGGSSLALRRLPADVDISDSAMLLQELCHDIRFGAKPGNLGVKDELLATVACKAAIKAGKASDPREWIPVVEAVVSGAVRYCPHGRPVTMRLTKPQLDKNFKRT